MLTIEDLKGKIRRTYLVALSAIALLLTVYFAWTQQYLVSTQIQPQIINIAGKQRMLSQRIAFLQNLLVSEDDRARRVSLKSELVDRTREFARSHEVLVARQSLNGLFTPLSGALETLYFSKESDLDSHALEYADRALELASMPDSALTSASPVSLSEATELLEDLDHAVLLFEQQLSAELRFNQWMLLGIWFITLGLSLLTVLLLFRPLKNLVLEQFNLVQEAKRDVEFEREQTNKVVSTKEEFLASMSHEFRSPISAIIGALELMPNMQSRQGQLIQKAEQSCYRLLMLTSNLVDSMQSKQIDEVFVNEDFDLIRLLDDALSQFAYNCQQKNLHYQVKNESTLPHYVNGNSSSLIKALKNILDNAVKFTPEGSVSVYNRLSVSDGKLLLTIRVVDTGIGIPESDLQNIFQRFYKAHGNSRLYSGAGVGLYASRTLVEQAGGTITVTSALHNGSEFTLNVPLNAAKGDTREAKKPVSSSKFAVVDDQEITRIHLSHMIESEGYHVDTYLSGADLLANQDKLKTYDGIITDYYMPGINGAELANYLQAMLGERMPPVIMVSAAPQIANIIANSNIPAWQVFVKPIDRNRFIDSIHHLSRNKGKSFSQSDKVSVLIVEDEPINAEILRDMVENLGYDVTLAEDGESALSRAGEEDFSIILLDINLPDMNGFEVATILKERGCKSHLVAVTASAYESDKQRSMEVGMRYHLVKPVAYQELKNTMKLLLAVS